MNAIDKFYIQDKIAVITGGAGLLGRKHADAVIEGKGIPVLIDISESAIGSAKEELRVKYGDACIVEGYVADITDSDQMEKIAADLLSKYGHADILINNAANNPKVEGNAANMKAIQFENFSMRMWLDDLNVGLTGAFI